jgi:hypothetical protein
MKTHQSLHLDILSLVQEKIMDKFYSNFYFVWRNF